MNRSPFRPKRWLVKWRRSRANARAAGLAMERFSRLHPHWHGAFFDQHFIERVPRATLERRDGAELALEWARQFRYSDERQRMIDIRQVTPVAGSFLRLLAMARRELPVAESSGRVHRRRNREGADRVGREVRRRKSRCGQEPVSSASAKAEAARRH